MEVSTIYCVEIISTTRLLEVKLNVALGISPEKGLSIRGVPLKQDGHRVLVDLPGDNKQVQRYKR